MPQPCLPLTTISGKPYKWGTWVSPVARIEEGGENKLTVSAINISETLSADIAPWLDANVNVGYNSSAAWRDMVRKTYDTYTYLDVPAGKDEMRFPYSRSTSSRTDFYSLTGYLHGHHTFAKQHNLSLTAGVQYEFKDYRVFGVAVRDPNTALDIINGTGEVSINDLDGDKKKLANRWQFSNLSYFFRFNYDFDGRYLLEFNGRYDGSSKFQSKNRWEFFYGVSGAWRINQEKFLRDIDWISNLKVRLSYAEMGNQSGISNYDGYQLYVINSNNGAYVGNDKLSTITTNGTFASNSRSWERIKNFNVGLDFGFLNGAISGSVDYFEKHNDNMLIGVTYPSLLGDKAPSSNSGKFKDWGFDGQITYNGRVGDWNYHVGGTFTFARNKIQDIQGSTLLTSGFTSVRQGYPINSLFGLRYGGKIQNEEQLKAYVDKFFPNNGVGMPDNLRVGDNMFCDENGDGVLDYNDYIFLGSDTPRNQLLVQLRRELEGHRRELRVPGCGQPLHLPRHQQPHSAHAQLVHQHCQRICRQRVVTIQPRRILLALHRGQCHQQLQLSGIVAHSPGRPLPASEERDRRLHLPRKMDESHPLPHQRPRVHHRRGPLGNHQDAGRLRPRSRTLGRFRFQPLPLHPQLDIRSESHILIHC